MVMVKPRTRCTGWMARLEHAGVSTAPRAPPAHPSSPCRKYNQYELWGCRAPSCVCNDFAKHSCQSCTGGLRGHTHCPACMQLHTEEVQSADVWMRAWLTTAQVLHARTAE
eukprot:103504-Chlamydomonas_euryale.AAC.2